VCFGFTADGRCNVVRIGNGKVVLGRGQVSDKKMFGREIPDASLEFEPVDGLEVDLSATLDPNLNIIRVERQPGAWFVNVNEKEVGVFGEPAGDEAVYVRVNKGTAYFSNIYLVSLERAASKPGTKQ
jgi:hypothetical protein